MVREEVVQVTLSIPVDVDTWEASPQSEKDEFRERIADFFSDAQEDIGYTDVKVNVRIYVIRYGELVELRRRKLQGQQVVVNTGECIVVVEIIVPPDTTPEVVRNNLDQNAIEMRTGEDSAVNRLIEPQTAALGLGAAVVTSSTIQQVPLIASPPPPSPENITPYTDLSLIFIVVGSVIGMFLLIVIARECDAERIRIGTSLFSAIVNTFTGGNKKSAKTPEEKTVTIVIPSSRDPSE